MRRRVTVAVGMTALVGAMAAAFVGVASAQEKETTAQQEKKGATTNSSQDKFTTQLKKKSQAKKKVRALWHMGNPARLIDSSPYRNNGSTHHIKGIHGGFRGKGYHFNGSSSIVRVPSAANLNPRRANIRLTVHVKFARPPSEAVRDYDLIRKGTLTSPGGKFYKAEILRSGQAFCFFKGSLAKGKVIAGPNLANGHWHTIRCTKTPTRVRLTVDGKKHTKRVRVGSIANTDPLTIGARSGGGDWYAGQMDEVSVRIS